MEVEIVKIGLITYHSAYNFGSVLQAYAMQEYLKSEIGNCEIINYRTKNREESMLFLFGIKELLAG